MLGIAMGLGLDTVTTRNTILALLPIGSMSWFAQIFLVLYILTPVINRLLHWLQHRYYLILLAASTVIWFVIPTALNLWPNRPHTTFGFKHIFYFIVFYSMGAYIKLAGSSIKLCSSYITQKTGIILSTIGILGAFGGGYPRRCISYDWFCVYETDFLFYSKWLWFLPTATWHRFVHYVLESRDYL